MNKCFSLSLSPYFCSTYHQHPLKLSQMKRNTTFDLHQATVYDSVFVLSNGRITSIGPGGEFNWQVTMVFLVDASWSSMTLLFLRWTSSQTGTWPSQLPTQFILTRPLKRLNCLQKNHFLQQPSPSLSKPLAKRSVGCSTCTCLVSHFT